MVNMQTELSTGSQLANPELKCIDTVHLPVGTPRRVRVPVLWEMLPSGQTMAPLRAQGGRVLKLCLAHSSLYGDTIRGHVASTAGGIYPVHCLRRDDATFRAEEG
ncbi:unnamed protein product [Pylaiella littoralis]